MNGKALLDIEGKPLIWWILRRLTRLPGKVVLAIPGDQNNISAFRPIVKDLGLSFYAGSNENDVIDRINGAYRSLMPDAQYILRALGDCPFLETSLIIRALETMEKFKKEAFVWHLAPSTFPVYGAREFPFSIKAWKRISIYAQGTEREHTDMYFHQHRSMFDIAYHEPPESSYFRPYRLEVDWKEDAKLIRAIAHNIGMDAPLSNVIRFLDAHPELADINRQRVEKTGTSTYEYATKREWMKSMRGHPVIGWNDNVWHPPSPNATPVFCSSGKCHLGFGHKGSLYTHEAVIRGDAQLFCNCGSGKFWRAAY